MSPDPCATYQQHASTLCAATPFLVFLRTMSEARITSAIDRIEKALARIETQAALGRSGSGDAALARKHEALRESVSASLAELDTLIERLER